MKLKKLPKFLVVALLTLVSVITFKSLRFEPKEISRKSKRSPAGNPSKDAQSSAPNIPRLSLPAKEKDKEQSLLSEIFELAECYQKECALVSTDSRDEYYGLGQKLKSKLAEYNSYVTKNEIKDSRVTELALQFLAHSDGHVQEMALELMATQDPSDENLDAILENIINGFDAELIHQAFLELQRYTTPRDQEKIRLALGQALLHGSPFVSVAIAGKINLILNEENISFFEEMMSNLDPKSRVYENLKFSIQEFEQLSRAG